MRTYAEEANGVAGGVRRVPGSITCVRGAAGVYKDERCAGKEARRSGRAVNQEPQAIYVAFRRWCQNALIHPTAKNDRTAAGTVRA